jgi:hypothetical protein
MLYDRSEPEAAAEPERAPVTAAAPRPAGGTDKAAMVDPAHEPERAGAGALLTAERPEPAPAVEPATGRSWAVSATLLLATVAAVVLGFLPQIVLWAADAAAQLLLP